MPQGGTETVPPNAAWKLLVLIVVLDFGKVCVDKVALGAALRTCARLAAHVGRRPAEPAADRSCQPNR